MRRVYEGDSDTDPERGDQVAVARGSTTARGPPREHHIPYPPTVIASAHCVSYQP